MSGIARHSSGHYPQAPSLPVARVPEAGQRMPMAPRGSPALISPGGVCETMGVDALSDVLRTLRLTGGLFLDGRYTAPWCFQTNVPREKFELLMGASAHLIAFHYVVSGSLVAYVRDDEPHMLEAGALILLPRNDLHVLGSGLGLKPASADELFLQDFGPGLWELAYGGGGDETHIVCGFLGCDASFDPLLTALPPILSLNVSETKGGAWIQESFAFAAQSLAAGGVGAGAIVARLSEIMFVEALRRFVGEMPEGATGWLAGLRDPAIGRALALMHADPKRQWSVELLAEGANMSRSAFADRFSTVIGCPPMRYLITWRMQIAARMLRETSRTVAQIAFDVGYDSEAAFTRAFGREFGRPPSAWRKSSPG